MGSCALNATTTDGHIQFHGCCVNGTCESLILGLTATNNRAGKELFVDQGVHLLHLVLELTSFFCGGMCGMTFLPQELSRSNEGSRMLELPTDHVRPLVGEKGQITMGTDPLSE